jgi:hypothetical protein
MSGFFAGAPADTAATVIGALLTLGVWAYLLGERRFFRLAQYLLAGLATGYLVVLAVREVLLPRMVQPLLGAPAADPLLWAALLLVLAIAGAHWLPRTVVALPVSLLVAGTAAFALAGAVAGTLLPQLASASVAPGLDPAGLAAAIIGALITVLVVVSFLHGAPRARLVAGAAGIGRWLLLAGVGGWLGFLLVSRLALLVDRLGFLVGDLPGVSR